MADDEGPKTVGELIAILSRFGADEPIQFTSTDGPDYGWLEVGGAWSDGGAEHGYLYGEVQIRNDGVVPTSAR